jgi:nucleotide-binding universal stress UspA family protein
VRAKTAPTPHEHAIRSLLVAIDLSALSDRVVGRVALLPFAPRARITLLHVVPRALPPRARERASRDARKALEAELALVARALPAGVQARAVVKIGAAAAEIASGAAAVGAELIAIGRGGRRAREAFLGSTAERVIRRAAFPVLAVRQPSHAPYRRPAIALALDEAAPEVVGWLLRLIPPPRPRVPVIHAYDTPLHQTPYPSLSDDDVDADQREKALRALEKILARGVAAAGVDPNEAPRWRPHVRCGSARSIIEHDVRKLGADLVLLGTHGRSGVAHAFLGTVAGDVLRHVDCDVLVAPPRRGNRG